MIIAPQKGPQEAFLGCKADVAFYGGAAGGGKSVALIMDPLHYATKVKKFAGTIFRRTCPEITNPGGLWDESCNFYPFAGAVGNSSAMRWTWPKTGSWMKFSHLQHEANVHSWQGSQMAYIGFDELTHFSRRMFFYLISRARSACGVNPYVRATMNPDPDHWVREFIDWYIGPDGFPIPERSGVIRYFARKNGDKIEWSDDPEVLRLLGLLPKSFTFISANVDDNPIMLENNPDYKANLETLQLVERERLLKGNWNVRAMSGMLFRRAWFEERILDAAPKNEDRTIRYWDRAATEPNPRNTDPDWTRGLKMSKLKNRYTVHDVVGVRMRPEGVLSTIRATAKLDGEDVEQWLELDPGQAGLVERAMYQREMRDFNVRFYRPQGSKVKRAMVASQQSEAGNIYVVRGPYLNEFLQELEAFADWDSIPDEEVPANLPHDDQVDTLSGAVNVLLRGGVEII